MTNQTPTIQDKVFHVGVSVKTKATKDAKGNWVVVIEASGKRPRFEVTDASRAMALYHIGRKVEKWGERAMKELAND